MLPSGTIFDASAREPLERFPAFDGQEDDVERGSAPTRPAQGRRSGRSQLFDERSPLLRPASRIRLPALTPSLASRDGGLVIRLRPLLSRRAEAGCSASRPSKRMRSQPSDASASEIRERNDSAADPAGRDVSVRGPPCALTVCRQPDVTLRVVPHAPPMDRRNGRKSCLSRCGEST